MMKLISQPRLLFEWLLSKRGQQSQCFKLPPLPLPYSCHARILDCEQYSRRLAGPHNRSFITAGQNCIVAIEHWKWTISSICYWFRFLLKTISLTYWMETHRLLLILLSFVQLRGRIGGLIWAWDLFRPFPTIYLLAMGGYDASNLGGKNNSERFCFPKTLPKMKEWKSKQRWICSSKKYILECTEGSFKSKANFIHLQFIFTYPSLGNLQ